MSPTVPPLRAEYDLGRAEEDLSSHGVTLIEGALPPNTLAATRTRLFSVAAEEDAAGRAYRYDGLRGTSDDAQPNQRVWALLNKGPEFVSLALELMRLVMGTLIAFEGRLWHQTGPNTSAADRRAGIFAFYSQPWLCQQENWAASLDPRVLAESPQELRALAGLEPFMGLGFVDGPPADMPRF